MSDKYKSFLIGIGAVLKEDAVDAKKEKIKAMGTDKESFATGCLFGYYSVITMMQQHAELYEIDLSLINLNINENDII